MEIIDRWSLAKRAAEIWSSRYSEKHWRETEKDEVQRKLNDLGPIPNPDDIERIIGNTSWTDVPECSECGDSVDKVCEIGEYCDHGSLTAFICLECLKKAVGLMDD